jgi:hypothetical protein
MRCSPDGAASLAIWNFATPNIKDFFDIKAFSIKDFFDIK